MFLKVSIGSHDIHRQPERLLAYVSATDTLISITNITTAVNPFSCSYSFVSRSAPKTTIMKQPKNRRGLPLQRNNEGNFRHVDFSIGRVRRLLSLGIICNGSLSYIASRNILTCLHSLYANTHNTYNDFHRQFQLDKLVSPFLSCTSIAIRHPQTVSTYMLFFNLATSSAFEAY